MNTGTERTSRVWLRGSYVGVAPTARLIGLKVLDGQGQGTTDNVIRAIEFAIVNKTALDIKIINLSLGHPIFESAATDPLVQAVEHASRAGIVVVVSAGNFGRNRTTGQMGYAGIASPGNAPSRHLGRLGAHVRHGEPRRRPHRGVQLARSVVVRRVCEAGYRRRRATTSSRWRRPRSTLRLAQEAAATTGNYMRLSGTSMAAGVVSGVVAMVLQNNQRLTPNAVKMVLAVFGDSGEGRRRRLRWTSLTQGAGRSNGSGALALARAINPRRRSA